MAASVASGFVSNSSSGLVLTYTDTGTYNPPITSRILNVFDANNVLVTTVNMGSLLTASINITFDQWLSFQCTVIDSTGTFTKTINFLAENIVLLAIFNRVVSTGCLCRAGEFCDIFKAQLNISASEWFSQFGLGISADKTITAANIFANTNNNINF